MNNPDTYGFQDLTPAQDMPAQGPPSMGQYKFSPDEMRVLQECNRDSFYKRSLPGATLLGFGTFVGVQQGYFKPNPRFGAFPKVTLAVVVGYFIGKLSYQQACAEKLMALPGSYIGQLLRDRRDGKIGSAGRTSMPSQPGGMLGAGPNDIYSDAGPGSSLDLDTDRPVFSDDTYRPDNESSTGFKPDDRINKPSLSYDDLRRKNRGDYASSKQDPYRTDLGSGPTVMRPRPPPPAPPAITNKYGDMMD